VREGIETVKTFTPFYVYQGSALLNPSENQKGCLGCQQNCPGGLICNMEEPCCKAVPCMKPDWERIPAPGTVVTLVVYVMPER